MAQAGAPRGGAASNPSPASRADNREIAVPRADLSAATAAVRRLAALEKADKGGVVSVPGGRVEVGNLSKVFFPARGQTDPERALTKGDLLRYYTTMAPLIVPAMADRPLVLKRYPQGIDGKAFYQQSAPDEPPAGVRVETVELEPGKPQRRLVGGNVATLIYTIQLGAISFDPWHSRIGSLHTADYTVLDLDPGRGATFETVVEVAHRVREEMDRFGLHGALKTSGSRGLHVYLPLPEGTPLEAATLVAQIVATRVAEAHPRIATVERYKKNRPRGTVYVDYLQNILGKTVAGVYAVRAVPGGRVSTPLRWAELDDALDASAFTLLTVPDRVREVGDLWAAAMATPNDLAALRAAARR